jgi:hypothetical protein
MRARLEDALALVAELRGQVMGGGDSPGGGGAPSGSTPTPSSGSNSREEV